MDKPDETHVGAAQRLLAISNAHSASECALSLGRVYDSIFLSLAPVIGAAGVRAFFDRSIQLTRRELGGLSHVVLSPGARGTSDDVAQQVVAALCELDPGAASEVAHALIANFLRMLCSFIGERLVWQLVEGARPPDTSTHRTEKK